MGVACSDSVSHNRVQVLSIPREPRTTFFIESTGIACSISDSHNRVQVLSIPVLLLACSQGWTCNLQRIVSLEA